VLSHFLRWKRNIPLLLSIIFKSNSDLILGVCPLRKKHQQQYFPPPGYGLPPSCCNEENKKGVPEDAYYGFYLLPGKLGRWHIILTFLMAVVIASPFLVSDTMHFIGFIICSISYFLIAWGLYHALFRYWNTPVLSHLWQKWPKPFYHKLLSVPHYVCLKPAHYKYKQHSFYWHPDFNNSWFRQASYFAPKRLTLQEVMLNLAIFEFFFPAANEQYEKNFKKTKLFKHWVVFLCAPFWINLLLLFSFFIILHSFNNSFFASNNQYFPIFQLPNNIIVLALIWSTTTILFILSYLPKLEDLRNHIQKGYFDSPLEQVPQQILNEVNKHMPSSEQVAETIRQMQKAIAWINIGVLANIFMILEVIGGSS